jgi:hypothetical protein
MNDIQHSALQDSNLRPTDWKVFVPRRARWRFNASAERITTRNPENGMFDPPRRSGKARRGSFSLSGGQPRLKLNAEMLRSIFFAIAVANALKNGTLPVADIAPGKPGARRSIRSSFFGVIYAQI